MYAQIILAQEIIWRVTEHVGCEEQSSPALAVALHLAEGRGGLCLHGHLAVQPLESHHGDHCVHRRELRARPGQLSCSFSCGSCQRQTTNKALPVPHHAPSSWAQPCPPRREPREVWTMHDKLQFCLAWRPAEGHVCSSTTTQIPHLGSWEWENALGVTEIHSIHSFRASSSAFFARDKSIAWILPENIWPPIVRALFKERGYFYSGHQLLWMAISQHLEKEQGKRASSSAGSMASPGQVWHLCEHLRAQRECSFSGTQSCTPNNVWHVFEHGIRYKTGRKLGMWTTCAFAHYCWV